MTTDRRTVLKAGAWSVPVVALAATTPMAAASAGFITDANIVSTFGQGWYPYTIGNQTAGRLVFDTALTGDPKEFTVNNTLPGDVISNISVELHVSAGWAPVTFAAAPGSNLSWSTPLLQPGTVNIDGVDYRRYVTTYTGTVVATGSTTQVPIGFSFHANTPFVAGQVARVRRRLTVTRAGATSTVAFIRAAANIIDTNSTTPPAPSAP